MTLFRVISCYHLPEVVIKEKVYKIIFSGFKVLFFMVNIANLIHYFIFYWIFRIMFDFFQLVFLRYVFWQILHVIINEKNNKWPVKDDYLVLGGQTGCHVIKDLKNKKILSFEEHLWLDKITCIMFLFIDSSCFHFPNTAIKLQM